MSPPLVVITDSNLPSDGSEERLLVEAGLEVARAQCRDTREVIAAAAHADALIVQWAPITAAVIDELECCRFISRLGIGVDMIDLAAASRRGIAVANTPEYCVEEVAAHAVALALAASRGVLSLDRSLRAGEWAVVSNAPTVLRPSAAVFAVIGFGRIGARVAATARSAGYRVVVHDPCLSPEAIAAGGFEAVSLDDALERAHILTLHLPLRAETHHLIDAAALARMQPTSFIVNTSRGGLIDEEALARALRAGTIGGACLDVFEHEPLPAESVLRDVPNLLLTPHAAWYSSQALAELPLEAARNVREFFAGRPPASIVNPDYLDALR